ncbi:MAG: hypothetical protein HY918_04310 [Candidatus Doudnabacteria bacterium]|nr:hypothetical protein [Candidatus Doudnabacteria bacterium]
MKNLKKIFYSTRSIIFSGVVMALPVVAKAVEISAEDKVRCTKFKNQFNGVFANMPDQYCSASALLLWVIQLLLVMSGIVAVLFVMLGGVWYLTAAGNDEQAEKGKKTLINAIIGLVVILLAATIVRVVSNTLALGK